MIAKIIDGQGWVSWPDSCLCMYLSSTLEAYLRNGPIIQSIQIDVSAI
jgi:hypothetical protein